MLRQSAGNLQSKDCWSLKTSLWVILAALARWSASESKACSQAYLIAPPMSQANNSRTSLPWLWAPRSGNSASIWFFSLIVCTCPSLTPSSCSLDYISHLYQGCKSGDILMWCFQITDQMSCTELYTNTMISTCCIYLQTHLSPSSDRNNIIQL